jgi:hypothetical protein
MQRELGPEPGPDLSPTGPSGLNVTRRRFLAGAVGLGAALYAVNVGGVRFLRFGDPFGPSAAGASEIPPPDRIPDFLISGERDTDLVLLDFGFYGFSLRTVAGVPTLSPTTTDNVVVVRFPPQSIGEAVYPLNGGQTELPVDPPPIASAVSGPSRLCFNLDTSDGIPLPTMTVADLLDWSTWTLVVPPVAQVNPPVVSITGAPSYPVPGVPEWYETAIEFPYALFISPVTWGSGLGLSRFTTYFTSRPSPLNHLGITDLWTTTLGSSSAPLLLDATEQTSPAIPILPTAGPITPEVSAVWAYDYGLDYVPNGDYTGLDGIYYGPHIQ